MDAHPHRPRASSATVVCAAAVLNALLIALPVMLAAPDRVTAVGVSVVVFLVVATGWCLAEGLASGGASGTMRGPNRLAIVIGLGVLVTFWVSMIDGVLGTHVPHVAAIAVGSGLMAGGVWLRCAAILALGPGFLNGIAIAPGRTLVTGGVYALCRHPSELGTACLAIGGAVLLASPYGLLAAAALLLPCQVQRVRLEHRLLIDHYGEAYSRYARHVPLLLPRVVGLVVRR